MSDRDPRRSQGRRRTSETSSVSACEALQCLRWLKGSYPKSCQVSTRFFSNPFQFVSRLFHVCCFALPARINVVDSIIQDCDCTLHNAVDDKQLVVSRCSGWYPKVSGLPKFLLHSVVFLRSGQTKGPRESA